MDKQNLEKRVADLEKQMKDLLSPSTFPELLVQTMIQKGFLHYDNLNVLTYVNPSGKEFRSVFIRYNNERVVIAYEPYQNFIQIESVNTSTDTITIANHGLSDGTDVSIATTDTPPAPLAVQTIYYVRDATTNTFKLTTTPGGSAVNLTSIGLGLNFIHPV